MKTSPYESDPGYMSHLKYVGILEDIVQIVGDYIVEILEDKANILEDMVKNSER